MIEVVTAISMASSAFSALKKGITVGKDLQDMGQQLSKWAGAMSDLDFLETKNKNPSVFQILGGGVESQAMEIFAARKRANAMRQELKDYISVVYGPSHWEELLRIEAEIRVQKRENEYRRLEIIQNIKEWAAGITLFLILVGALFGFIWLAMNTG
tara:strand:+ start:1197 stop:1664 length:468 start_codon:yes stop_codon:yes gene_type:complete